jgi:hypothetical protein
VGAALVGPTEIDAVEIGGIAVAEAHGEDIAAVNLGVLAVEFSADFREAVGGNELVSETLTFLLVAGNALGQLEADILQVD